MESSIKDLDTLKDIRKMMERSSRFVSLSGWSGVVVGICALVGALVAQWRISEYFDNDYSTETACPDCLKRELLLIATLVFVTALVTATLFTLFKSKKEEVAIWGSAARRLLWNTSIPMAAGAFILWRMVQLNQYDLVAAGCLIFYGLALVNGSKYTLGEVRYLGYAEIVLGILTLWLSHTGLFSWALGFGVFHIIYGVAMWWKYERVLPKEIAEPGLKKGE